MKQKLQIKSGAKAMEILAIEGWRALSKSTDQKHSWPWSDRNENQDDCELPGAIKAMSQLKINLIKSGFDNAENIVFKPKSSNIYIQGAFYPHEIYDEKNKRINENNIRKIIDNHFAYNSYELPLPTFECKISEIFPDAILYFVTKVNIDIHEEVTYQKDKEKLEGLIKTLNDKEGAIWVRIIPTVICIPIYKRNDCSLVMPYLDFDGITYKTFKRVATEGWDRKKYAHYLYIEDANLYRGGGFFIGLTREPCESHFDEWHGYFSSVTLQNKFDFSAKVPIKVFKTGASIKTTKSCLKRIEEKNIENKLKNLR